MSVESLRKFVEKYGTYIFGLMFVAFALSFLTMGPKCGSAGQGPVIPQGPSIASIGQFKATANEVDGLVNSQVQNSQEPVTPLLLAQAYSTSTNNVIDHLFSLALAADKGIVMDDKAVEEAIPSLWSDQLKTFRQILEQDVKLSPSATDKDVADAFQKDFSLSQGRTLDQQKQKFTDDFNAAFNDPTKRELIRSEVARQQLMEKMSAINSPSDAEVQNSFGTYNVLKLEVQSKPGVDARDIAQKALNDIKGGMKFEDAITKYSNVTPLPGKSLTAPQDVSSMELQFSPNFRPLLDLKTGDTSGVLDMGQGSFAIFKVIKFTPHVPADFASKKDQVRQTMMQMGPQLQLQEDLEALKTSGKLQWNSEAYHAMYDYSMAANETPDKRTPDLKKVQTNAKNAIKGDAENGKVAALAYYIATNTLYADAKPNEKDSYDADRIASMEAVLQETESPDLRIQLVDLYLKKNKTKEAADELETASKMINGGSATDLGNYEMILAREDKMDSKDQLPADKKASIEKALADWRSTMIQSQQIRMESIKDQEKLDAANRAAFEKQQKEDAAKKAAAAAAAKKTAAGSKSQTPQPQSNATAPKPAPTTTTVPPKGK